MDNKDINTLVEAFVGYRAMLEPIQSNLSNFVDSYDLVKDELEKLSKAFGGDAAASLDKIYKTVSAQAEKASELSGKIDQFARLTDKYSSGVASLVGKMEKIEERLSTINQIEGKAEEQIGKLDNIIEEKRKSYNLKELQKNLEGYNDSVQKVSEFINKNVADSLSQNYTKLDDIKKGSDDIAKRLLDENSDIEKLAQAYTASNEILRQLVEKQDVNEAYIFDILDKWAEERKVKTRK
ncbi:MAG: hypothetical protein RR993_02580 [Clostridia bacterium]